MKLYFKLSILIAALLITQTSVNAMLARAAKSGLDLLGETARRTHLRAAPLQRSFTTDSYDQNKPIILGPHFKVTKIRYIDPFGQEITRTIFTQVQDISSEFSEAKSMLGKSVKTQDYRTQEVTHSPKDGIVDTYTELSNTEKTQASQG